MSYSKSYRKTIPVYYSGSVRYPASENGGSVSYSGTVNEEVVIDVYVETNEFDNEVRYCNNSVKDLTGSIIATEAAQVASIRDKAHKVGDTLIKGFFSTVRSEISQQIMELTTKVEATLVHLKKMAERCQSKQAQMQTDYARTSSRYMKIFEDLNKELEHRIYELCRPAFTFKRSTDERILNVLNDDIATTAVISGAEHSLLEAQLASSLTKRRAVDTIMQANTFLTKQKRTELVLNHITIDETENCSIYLPICYLETKDNSITNRNVYKPEKLSNVNSTNLIEEIAQRDIPNELENNTEILEEDFNRTVSTVFKTSNEHDRRVMNYITKLFYSNINNK